MHPLTIIFGFILAVTIVAFGFGLVMHKRQIAYKERKNALDREAKYGASPASADKHRELEERVRVLERIATDNKVDLAMQIEALRDVQELDRLEQNAR